MLLFEKEELIKDIVLQIHINYHLTRYKHMKYNTYPYYDTNSIVTSSLGLKSL